MWGVIAAWVVCLASLSMPWPGIIVVGFLCCLAFFEFASPTAWLKPHNNKNSNSNSDNGNNSVVGRNGEREGVAGGGLVTCIWAIVEHASSSLQERWQQQWRSAGGNSGNAVEALSELDGQTSKSGGGGGGGGVAGNGGVAEGAESNGQSIGKASAATFLKGSVGSFSRGGLMVTHDGRVIYKINQDRGLISHPSLSQAQHTIFGIFDGHGENGEHVAAYAMREVPRRLAQHADALEDPATALKQVYEDINSSLPKSGINAIFGGTTAVVALVRGPTVWVANAGDSRAVVAGKGPNGKGIVAHALSRDQNPDTPGERERIKAMGGFVSDPEEPGASARVWLDETQTMVGLAMSRSIGDLAVKRVGVIAEPEISEYKLTATDEFLVLASDGVWEFIDNQEAAEVVQTFFDKGEDAAGACKGLMELANRRWSDMVGDYRDDITATVVRLPFLPPAAAAAATAAATSSQRGSVSDSGGAASTTSSSVTAPIPSSSGAAEDKAAACAEAALRADGSGPDTACVGSTAVPGRNGDHPSGRCTIGGGIGMSIGGGAGEPTIASRVKVVMSTKGERRLTVALYDVAPDSNIGTAATAADDSPGSAAVEEEDTDTVSIPASTAVEHEGGAGRSPSDLNSTPAITPDGASEEEEDGGEGVQEISVATGGDRVTIEEKASHGATIQLLSAVSDAFECGGGSSLSPGSASKLGKVDAEVGATVVEEEGSGESAAAGAVDENDMNDEEWELEFGARECREPSREILEASREFPAAYGAAAGRGGAGSIDPLEALVAGMDASSTSSKRPVIVT